MKDARDLFIDLRIELRKLQRDFHKTDLCKRLDEAIYQLGRPQRPAPAAVPAAPAEAASVDSEAFALALAWQEAAQQLKDSQPAIHAELCRAVLLRMGLPAGTAAPADHSGGALPTAAAEPAPTVSAVVAPPPEDGELGVAILTAVAAGERALSEAQREIAVGEAVVLSGFEVNPEELIALGDAEIGRVLLDLREREPQM